MKLRIATMITGHYRIPPPEGTVYAPMDIAKTVAEGLVRKGHEVTFFAPKGSDLAVTKMDGLELEPLMEKEQLPIMSMPNVRDREREKIANLWDQYLLAKLYRQAAEGAFDLIYIHPIDRALPFAFAFQDIPTVYTLHDPIYEWRTEIFRRFQSKNQWFVTASKAQQAPAPELPYAGVVHHGIDVRHIPVGNGDGNYFLYLGRITKDKGVHEAIAAIQKTQERLVIAGPAPTSPAQQAYWDEYIAPHLGEQVQYIGPRWGEARFELFGKAKGTLFPGHEQEAFGLVMAESLACGTPVIGFRRASIPEVIEHGKTGFVANNPDEMAQYISQASTISRQVCRSAAEARFTTERMVDEYEKIFVEISKKKS